MIKTCYFVYNSALGFIIILEFLVMLSLGAVMLFYTCKCAISLINERRNPDVNEDADHPIQTSDRQCMVRVSTYLFAFSYLGISQQPIL